ncbi:hypothetical protein [uncultured Thiocystis sp.]|jgi:tetratricopeptide (TPR) repeat protein|uniref:hypothetical protein n=1 Tax=uncultured Thiocystis sp. TaxID=1202134 RepID=UPI0025E07AD0|nr:hypothetical protein [uncultured Thiocystis sp.]
MLHRFCFALTLWLLALHSCGAGAADCQRGKSLADAARAEPNLRHRITLLRESTELCPDPVAINDLVMAYVKVGDQLAALKVLMTVEPDSRNHEQRVKRLADLARAYLEQNRLPEAIACIETAIDQAAKPAPEWLLELRRRIDTHPQRASLRADQINRGLEQAGQQQMIMNIKQRIERGDPPISANIADKPLKISGEVRCVSFLLPCSTPLSPSILRLKRF